MQYDAVIDSAKKKLRALEVARAETQIAAKRAALKDSAALANMVQAEHKTTAAAAALGKVADDDEAGLRAGLRELERAKFELRNAQQFFSLSYEFSEYQEVARVLNKPSSDVVVELLQEANGPTG